MTQMPRLRNIKQCLAWLKELDPDLPLTEHTLRILVAQGILPHVKNGKRILIDLDVLPGAIAKWAEAEQQNSLDVRDIKNKKPLSAVERANTGGRYGQVRALG